MWVYLKHREERDYLYVVGFFDPKGEWHSIRDYSDEHDAQMMCHYLNGGEIEK